MKSSSDEGITQAYATHPISITSLQGEHINCILTSSYKKVV